MRPIIALLTDFGLRDHYVAAMKGVILGICRDAVLVDITHDIPPQDIAAGALELAACYAAFPPGTIFLAVVDPGVGSARRAIAAEARGFRFVAPDNGLLSPVLDEARTATVVVLNRPEYAAASISRTFEGRDRFAPAAAWLATGVPLEQLGDPVDGWKQVAVPHAVAGDHCVEGIVVRIDRFGNLVTNIGRDLVARCAGGRAAAATVTVAGGERCLLVNTYSDVPAGCACAVVGSTGHLEISVNGGSAAERFRMERGARVTLESTP